MNAPSPAGSSDAPSPEHPGARIGRSPKLADGEPAEATAAQRNRPRFIDLPVPDDTANLREGPDLHPQCLGLLPLIGVWRGTGEVVYPTIGGPFTFGQQIVFAHDGRPFLSYETRSWLLDESGQVIRPAARETGFWRPQTDGSLEVLIAHATGIIEVFYGRSLNLTSWEISTDAVVRTAHAQEVNGSTRLYGVVEGTLAYVDEREMVGQPRQPHLSAQLARFAG